MIKKISKVACSIFFSLFFVALPGIPVYAASLSVDKPTAQIKEPVTATFSLTPAENEGGWVGVFVTGDPDTEYFWTQSAGEGTTTHTVSFDQPGEYEFRLFADYYQQKKVATASVNVVFSPSSTIAISATEAPVNTTVKAKYTVSERDGIDTGGWIGLYKKGADDDQYLTYQKTGGKSGEFEVTVPNEAGQYEFRLFMDYYGTWKLSTSQAITVKKLAEKPGTTKTAAKSDEPVDSKARFNNLNGIVEYTPDPETSEWQAVNLHTVLYVGDHIRTGDDSRAILQLEDMSTYVMGPNSEIIIETPPERETKLGLVVGRIWINTQRMFNEGTLKVEMGQAVAGIRGTTLVCEVAENVSTLKVIEGQVEFTHNTTGESVVATDGQLSKATENAFEETRTFDAKAEQLEWEKLGAPNVFEENPKKTNLVVYLAAAILVILIVFVVLLMVLRRNR